MAYPDVLAPDEGDRVRTFSGAQPGPALGDTSAVSWGAIVAGAAAAAALSLILLLLGTGLDLAAVSPWARQGMGATAFGVSTILWVTLTQLVAAGWGGYIAGRLRTRWLAVDPDEVYFRDTAHGFLAWAVASLATAALLTSVIGTIVGGGIQAGATAAGVTGAVGAVGSGPARSDSDSNPLSYFIDGLFRKDPGAAAAAAAPGTAAPLAEVARIFMHTPRTEALPAEDLRYVGQLVAQRTGLSQQEAERRVAEAQIAMKNAADKTRQASTYAALWLFISLLIGAFVASLAAIYGGRQRDA